MSGKVAACADDGIVIPLAEIHPAVGTIVVSASRLFLEDFTCCEHFMSTCDLIFSRWTASLSLLGHLVEEQLMAGNIGVLLDHIYHGVDNS